MPNLTPKHNDPRVAILVDTSTSWGRRIVGGINNYVKTHRPWHIFIEAIGMDEASRLPRDWNGDGIIARVSNVALARDLHRRQIPTVNVSGLRIPGESFPTVCTDLGDSGRIAATHLLERGFSHFGYFRLVRRRETARQQQNFIKCVERSGQTCSIYEPPRQKVRQTSWSADSRHIISWIRTLPKPVAILVENPSSGRQVIHACQNSGWSIPEDVAVLSCSDDELLCQISNIPISGVAVAAAEIGYEAAFMLDELMKNRELPRNLVSMPPIGVVTRQSTNILAVEDKTLADAVRFIRETTGRPIQVQDVMDAVHVSRRALERRFIDVLGRTPAAEIYHSRLERAKNLLLNSSLPIPEVADQAGFGSVEHMTHVFRKRLDQTPLQFRNRVR